MPATPEGATADEVERRVAELMGSFDEGCVATEPCMPSVLALQSNELPQPYRDLLAHDHGMTPTLEAYWKHRLQLRLLTMRRDGHTLMRQVVLLAAEIARPVGFGAIRIYLDRFAAEVCPSIVACETPLGTLLREHRVGHSNRLTGFFQVASETLTETGLHLEQKQTLYGRHNVLLTPSEQVMAEVVEILPPAEQGAGEWNR